MSDTNELPRVPDQLVTYIHAYGDSRADNDGMSHLRLGDLVCALREWAGSLRSSAPTAQSDMNELRARLLAHADVHDACTSSHSDEQAQWARDLREAAELISAPTAPAAGPQQDQTPWGWAIVDKNGDELLTRPRLREFFGAVNHEREPFSATELANANREWPGIAPFRIVTLYTHPAPAVERGVAEAQEHIEWLSDYCRRPYPGDDHLPHLRSLLRTLTATGAAQGDGARLVYGETEVSAPGAAIRAVQFHLTDAGAAALNVPAQQEAPAAQPLTDEQQEALAWLKSEAEKEDYFGRKKTAKLLDCAANLIEAISTHGIQPAATKGTT